MTSAILKKVVFFIALQIFSPQNRRTRNKIFPVTISNILMIVPFYKQKQSNVQNDSQYLFPSVILRSAHIQICIFFRIFHNKPL